MTNEPMILAIDQGTTNSKALLVNRAGRVVAMASRAVDIEYPQAGWVQQDAEQIWQSVSESIEECLALAGQPEIAAIGISNQRESGVAWERSSGRPIGPLVSWQCRRSAELDERLRSSGHEADVRARTGLPLDPMFSAGKFAWLLDAADARQRAATGSICLGTVDSWLLSRLTGGQQHATDISNASRTQLLSLANGGWDPVLLDLFDIPAAALPVIRPSAADYGTTISSGVLPDGIPIAALIGDSHAALFAHAGPLGSSVKATYGTGSSLMMATTSTALESAGGLATTVAWGLDETVFALEGNIYMTGATLQWLADFIGLEGPGAVAEIAATADDTAGVYLVPAFVGLGAPYWDAQARGLISGLTQGSTLPQLARSVIESIAFQVRDVFDEMRSASGQDIDILLADGGVTRNAQLMQFQADILGVPVHRNDTPELSALGAAYLAGLSIGTWASLGEIAALERTIDVFEPHMKTAERERRYEGWLDAVRRSRSSFA